MKRILYLFLLISASLCSQNCTPSVTANPAFICQGQQTATLSVSTAATSFSWTPASGLSATTGSLVLANPGATTIYTVTVTTGTCVASSTVQVTVNAVPVFSINPSVSGGCLPVCVNFSSTFTGAGSCLWNFGDGTNSGTCTTNHCFVNAGTYSVSLLIADSNLCSNSASAFITAYPIPQVDYVFNPNPGTVGNPINFSDVTTGASPVVWNWDFGDGNTSTLQNPSHVYSSSGNYFAWLKVASNMGCIDSIVHVVQIDPVGIHAITGSASTQISFDAQTKSISISNIPENTRCDVMNAFGEVIFRETFLNEKNRDISCFSWSSGIYFIYLENREGTCRKKIVVP